jgi:hypothetical protein
MTTPCQDCTCSVPEMIEASKPYSLSYIPWNTRSGWLRCPIHRVYWMVELPPSASPMIHAEGVHP